MTNEENVRTGFLRIELVLWLVFLIAAAVSMVTPWTDSDHWTAASLITGTAAILLILLTKLIKSILLKKTVRIIIYTILLVLFLYLVFIFPLPFID